MILADDGKRLALKKGIIIEGIASAHEEFKIDQDGHGFFLGYIFNFGSLTLYNSGDCVLYQGLEEKPDPFKMDLALLPVNGRSNTLSNDGINGNFLSMKLYVS